MSVLYAAFLYTLAWSRVGPWEVGEGFGDESTCSMIKAIGTGDNRTMFSVTYSPLKRSALFSVSRSDWSLTEGKTVASITFRPSEISYSGVGRVLEAEGKFALRVDIDNPQVLTMLAKSTHVLVVDSEGNATQIPLAGSAAAVEQMKRCTINRLSR